MRRKKVCLRKARWRYVIARFLIAALLGAVVGAAPDIASAQSPNTDSPQSALAALAAFNDSVRGAVCERGRGERVIYGEAGDAIWFQGGRVFYQYRRRPRTPYEIRGGAPAIQRLSFAAAFDDLDLRGVPAAWLVGDCRAVDLYCKETALDCITETRSGDRGVARTFRNFVVIHLPTERHVEDFARLFVAASFERDLSSAAREQ